MIFETEVTTTAEFQIVSDSHAALDFSYAWSLEEAQAQAEQMRKLHGNATIFRPGNFVPHYPDED